MVCFPAGTYTGPVTAEVANQTWRLDDSAQLNGAVHVRAAGVRVEGGTISRPTSDRWSASVDIRADDVTVASVDFRGGGVGVGVYGIDRARILDSSFAGLSGSAVSIWSEGVGADDTVIEGNSMVQSITDQVSPITSRGNETSSHGGVQNLRTIIRGNTIDQGAGSIGWFGIELKQSKGVVIENNSDQGRQHPGQPARDRQCHHPLEHLRHARQPLLGRGGRERPRRDRREQHVHR